MPGYVSSRPMPHSLGSPGQRCLSDARNKAPPVIGPTPRTSLDIRLLSPGTTQRAVSRWSLAATTRESACVLPNNGKLRNTLVELYCRPLIGTAADPNMSFTTCNPQQKSVLERLATLKWPLIVEYACDCPCPPVQGYRCVVKSGSKLRKTICTQTQGLPSLAGAQDRTHCSGFLSPSGHEHECP